MWPRDRVVVLVRDKSSLSSIERRIETQSCVDENVFPIADTKDPLFTNNLSAARVRILQLAREISNAPKARIREMDVSGSSKDQHLMSSIGRKLAELGQSSDFRKKLFPAASLRAEMQQLALEKEHLSSQRMSFEEKIAKLNEKDQQIAKCTEALSNLSLDSTHLLIMFDTLMKKNPEQLTYFNDELQDWTNSFVAETMRKKHEAKQQIDRFLRSGCLDQSSQLSGLKETYREYCSWIDYHTVSMDHFWREAFYLNELEEKSPPHFRETSQMFYKSLLNHIDAGKPFEIVDAENNDFHMSTLQKVFSAYEARYEQELENSAPFVVSIIGPQSSGKSTLLNFLFGSNFQMSAGRCTKGMYGTLLKTDYPGAELTVVLDTEGLLSIEKKDPAFDKRIAILSMGLAQVLVINVMGEMNEDMKQILSLSLFAAKQLKMNENRRPILVFVFRDILDDDIEKQRKLIGYIGEELKTAAETANVRIDEMVEYDEEKSFYLMFSAYNKDKMTHNEQETLYSCCTVNKAFRMETGKLLRNLLDYGRRRDLNREPSLTAFLRKANSYWQCLKQFNSLLSFSSIRELLDRNELQDHVTSIVNTYLERTGKRSGEDPEQRTFSMAVKEQAATAGDLELKALENQYQQLIQNALDQIIEKKGYSEELVREYKSNLDNHLALLVSNAKADASRVNYVNALKAEVRGYSEQISRELSERARELLARLQNLSAHQRAAECENLKFENREAIKDHQKIFEKKLENMRKSDQQLCQKTYEFLRLAVRNYYVTQRFDFINESHIMEQLEIFRKDPNKQEIHPVPRLCRPQELRGAHRLTEQQMKVTLKFLKSAIDYDQAYYYEVTKSYLMSAANQRRHENAKKDSFWTSSSVSSASPTVKKFINYYKERHWDPLEASLLRSGESVNRELGLLTGTRHRVKVTSAQMEVLVLGKVAANGVAAFCDLCEAVDAATTKYRVITNSTVHKSLAKIHKVKRDAEKSHLADVRMHWKAGIIEKWIAAHLFAAVLLESKEAQEKQIESAKSEFRAEIEQEQLNFERKLESTLGKRELLNSVLVEAVEQMKEKLRCSFRETCLESILIITTISSEQLAEKCDEILDYRTKADVTSKKYFLKWANNQPEYMEHEYHVFFDETCKRIIREVSDENRAMVQKDCNDLIQACKNLAVLCEDVSTRLPDEYPKLRRAIIVGKDRLGSSTDTDLVQQLGRILKKSDIHVAESLEADVMKMREILTEVMVHHINSVSLSELLSDLASTLPERMAELQDSIEDILAKEELSMNADLIMMKEENMHSAIGCREVCPYCGTKCDLAGPHQKHETKRHRPMGLKGSHSVEQGEVHLLKFVCTERHILEESKWKNVDPGTGSQLETDTPEERRNHNAVVKQMIGARSLVTGDLNITLAWSDPNDLDLHVIDPCGTHICHSNRECARCNGYLDLDMNALWFPDKRSATTPCEHVYFLGTAVEGKYEIIVNPYRMGLSLDGVKAGRSSKFKVYITDSKGRDLKVPFEKEVSESTGPVKMSYQYRLSLSFKAHHRKYFPHWIFSEYLRGQNTFISKCERFLFDFSEELKSAAGIGEYETMSSLSDSLRSDSIDADSLRRPVAKTSSFLK